MQKKPAIVLVILTTLVIALNAQALITPDTVPRMSIEELKRQMGNPNLIIIDVRTPDDWEKSAMKIKGSIREDPLETDSWVAKYPSDKILLFYCA